MQVLFRLLLNLKFSSNDSLWFNFKSKFGFSFAAKLVLFFQQFFFRQSCKRRLLTYYNWLTVYNEYGANILSETSLKVDLSIWKIYLFGRFPVLKRQIPNRYTNRSQYSKFHTCFICVILHINHSKPFIKNSLAKCCLLCYWFEWFN